MRDLDQIRAFLSRIGLLPRSAECETLDQRGLLTQTPEMLSLRIAVASTIASLGMQEQARPERDAWVSCLTNFAQIESAGTETPVTIALDALQTCNKERLAYSKRLLIAGGSRQAVDDQVAAEERDAARMLIGFVKRSR